MDPLTKISLGSTVIGGLKSLFQPKEDPYADIREEMQRIIAQIETEFPRLRGALRTREAVQRGGLVRRQQDFGAAAGLPENVVAQNINQAELGSMRNLDEALGRMDQQKMSTLERIAGLTGSLPPKPMDTSGQDLLGLGIQGLMAWAKPGDFDFLGKLFKKKLPSVGGFGASAGAGVGAFG